MSIPALAVLYGGIVQRKWAINTMMMVFSAFALTLIVWVLWAFKMGFGSAWIGSFIGKPGTVVGASSEQAQAHIPMLDGLMPKFRFPQSSLVYFQFVFAAITPILFIGSVIGRIKFKVWLIFVPLWITFAYAVNAFLLWGGGFWAGKGALDFSGGYVIHLAAGVSGFVAAAVVGPRLQRDRERAMPNNLVFVAVGAGILWLGWNGFNGGDPYFAGADASAAVINTNLATAVAMMTWIEEADLPGRRQRHDLRPGRNHPGGRLRQRRRRDHHRPGYLGRRLGSVRLPAQARLAVQQGGRRARRRLHARVRRPARRAPRRPAGRPEDDRLPRPRQEP
jgi:Amt family ammonium transporter